MRMRFRPCVRRVRRVRGDRGAAVVEFALLLPVLLTLVFGMVEFSRAYNAQATLSAAARIGARIMAVTGQSSQATAAISKATSTLDSSALTMSVPSSCPSGSNATVTLTYKLSFISRLFGSGLTLTGQEVMPCNG